MEKTGQPSRTAYSAARYRAAHQLFEDGRIFADPLALPILGTPRDELLADEPRRGMRLFIAARTRFAEDAIAAAVRRGVRQVVVLGAGLDTFAYRHPYEDLQVFEVDHPATQAWKRERLAAAGIAVPPSLTYVGVDFERESLASRLALDGPAFFVWLGVVPYLTREGFEETLAFVANSSRSPDSSGSTGSGLSGSSGSSGSGSSGSGFSGGFGSEVVFDYAQPFDRMSPRRRAALEARADRVASIGEPWLTYFEPEEIEAHLRGLGFHEIEDLGPSALAARFFNRTDIPPETPGGHVLRALRS